MTMKNLICALTLIAGIGLTTAVTMDTVYKWKYIDFTWESETQRQRAIHSGDYNYTQVVPMDVDRAPDGRVFITMDGIKGAPAVLTTVSDQMGASGPLLRPYPDWSYFKNGDCDSIQNVYRIAIDKCNRLWVLDVGYREEEKITCEPQLLTFDLTTDRMMQRIKIPNHIARGQNGQTLLAIPIVETKGDYCEETTVYMADPFGLGLVIWNNGTLFRLENPLFGPMKDAENITSGNYKVQWPAGIVTMAISPKLFPEEESLLYFHSLASFDLYAASTEVLKRSRIGPTIKMLGVKNILSSQAVGMAFSARGTLFMGLTKESAIACWNQYRELKPANIEIVSQDNDRLQYVNGMKIIREPHLNAEELWVISNRLTTFEYDKYDFNNYNFYVLKSYVNTLTSNTLCEIPYHIQRKLDSTNIKEDRLIFTD